MIGINECKGAECRCFVEEDGTQCRVQALAAKGLIDDIANRRGGLGRDQQNDGVVILVEGIFPLKLL
jgi:hypothetical protein